MSSKEAKRRLRAKEKEKLPSPTLSARNRGKAILAPRAGPREPKTVRQIGQQHIQRGTGTLSNSVSNTVDLGHSAVVRILITAPAGEASNHNAHKPAFFEESNRLIDLTGFG